MQRRYRGGFSAFQWGDLTVTQYDSGCLRSIVFRCYANIDTDIDQIYQEMGAKHEEGYVARAPVKRREIVVKHEILNGVLYSGRADFELEDDSITETKSSLKKKYRLPNEPKVNHLGQLTSYLGWLERELGRVDWGQYEKVKKWDGTTDMQQTDHKVFEVVIAEDGRLVINGEQSPYYVQDQLEHMHKAAELIDRLELHPVRPYNWDDKFKSPCTYCVFKEVCDSYDAGEIGTFKALNTAKQKLSNK